MKEQAPVGLLLENNLNLRDAQAADNQNWSTNNP